MRLRLVLVALVTALAIPVHAQDLATRAGEFKSAATAKAVQTMPMRMDGSALTRRVDLARPAASEVRKLLALNGNGASAFAAPGQPQFIGFGRDVAADVRKIDLGSLAWTTLGSGARVARVEVASADAASLRVALRLPQMHPDVSVRFAAAGASNALLSVPANTIAQATARFGEYWSPVIEGSRAAIEIEAEAGVSVGGVTLEIPRVSHLVVGMAASKAEEAKLLSDIGDAGPCNYDVKCNVVPQDQVTFNAVAATGKLVFTVESGGTARCSGTLLNDTINSTTPYVFSANHCFQTAYEASTLQVWWFFEAVACGSLTPGAYSVQFGGAALLGRSQDWDWALLRLNGPPPAGVVFSGWNTATVPVSNEVEIFHHPQGDLKKWSRGTSYVQVPVFFGTAAGGAGLFTRIIWNLGTTEGGSSGGALRTYNGSILEVRGGLLGGDALCSNPGGSDYFSQFGAMMPLVRQYLTPDFQDATVVVSVEFYNRGLNHFFMTVNPQEIAGLDSGVIVGWERTGFRFLAYVSPGPGRFPVCRFYRKPQFGDSHFFTADPAECAAVQVNYATDWVFENPAIYYVMLPTNGVCPAGTKAIYRYLNLAEINHRFTTEVTVANELSMTPGWQVEGSGPGPLYPVMCSPVGT